MLAVTGHGASTQFYSHAAFLSAAATFPSFATSSDVNTNKRELAAFLAHIAHETGGLCWIIEGAHSGCRHYCLLLIKPIYKHLVCTPN